MPALAQRSASSVSVERGEHHELRGSQRRVRLDAARQLQAVHAGHLHVEQHDVICLAAGSRRPHAAARPRSASSAAAPLRMPHAPKDGAEFCGWSRCHRRSARARPRDRVRFRAARGAGSACFAKHAVNQKGRALARLARRRRSRRPSVRRVACEIASPRPVPPKRRVVEPSACMKAWKSRACASGRNADAGVAHVKAQHRVCVRSRLPARTRSTTSPCSVNFTALPIRFVSTCRSRPGSPRRPVGTSAAR